MSGRHASAGTSLGGHLLVAAGGLVAVGSVVDGRALGAAVIGAGIALLVASVLGVDQDDAFFESSQSAGYLSLLVAVLTLMTASTLGRIDLMYGLGALALGGIAVAILATDRLLSNRARWLLLCTTLAVVALVVVVSMWVMREPRIDVLIAHDMASEALANGSNPYSAIVFPDTNYFAPPGSVFHGYVYWPPALLWYSVWNWVLGDPRWASAIAWVAAVVILALPWRIHLGRPKTYVVAGSLAAAMLAPMVHVIRNAWTEPMSFPLIAGSALTWRRYPVASAVLLGCAIATKQYFLLWVPLLLLWNDEFRWRRVLIVGGVIALWLLPFALADPQAFWEATIAPSLNRVARPDSRNIIAFGLTPPSWLGGAAAVGVAAVLGRRGGGGDAFVAAGAATLGTVFFLGSQAFVNYWALIAFLALTALTVAGIETFDRADRAGEQLQVARL